MHLGLPLECFCNLNAFHVPCAIQAGQDKLKQVRGFERVLKPCLQYWEPSKVHSKPSNPKKPDPEKWNVRELVVGMYQMIKHYKTRIMLDEFEELYRPKRGGNGEISEHEFGK